MLPPCTACCTARGWPCRDPLLPLHPIPRQHPELPAVPLMLPREPGGDTEWWHCQGASHNLRFSGNGGDFFGSHPKSNAPNPIPPVGPSAPPSPARGAADARDGMRRTWAGRGCALLFQGENLERGKRSCRVCEGANPASAPAGRAHSHGPEPSQPPQHRPRAPTRPGKGG